MKRLLVGTIVVLASGFWSLPSTAIAGEKFVIKKLATKKVTALPEGPLYWRIENFSGLERAKAASGTWALVAESRGKVWLFTLGPSGGSTAGGTKVGEVGPIKRIVAPEYILRINEATGAPGSVTSQHSHPGSEAFYVLAGEQTIRSPQGVLRVKAGQPVPGNGADVPMQVSSTGSEDLHSLVMFVVDATKPFSTRVDF